MHVNVSLIRNRCALISVNINILETRNKYDDVICIFDSGLDIEVYYRYIYIIHIGVGYIVLLYYYLNVVDYYLFSLENGFRFGASLLLLTFE